MTHRSPLQQFKQHTPHGDVYISSGSLGPTEICHGLDVIARYSRRRDAVRALKMNGYQQEGQYWRFITVAERETV